MRNPPRGHQVRQPRRRKLLARLVPDHLGQAVQRHDHALVANGDQRRLAEVLERRIVEAPHQVNVVRPTIHVWPRSAPVGIHDDLHMGRS